MWLWGMYQRTMTQDLFTKFGSSLFQMGELLTLEKGYQVDSDISAICQLGMC